MRQETYTVPWGIRNGMFVAFLLFLGIFIASFFVHYTRRIGLGTTVIEIDYPVDNSGSIESISPDKFRAILHCKWRWPVNRNFLIGRRVSITGTQSPIINNLCCDSRILEVTRIKQDSLSLLISYPNVLAHFQRYLEAGSYHLQGVATIEIESQSIFSLVFKSSSDSLQL